jgi:ABC-type phosphate/phosphonate transport system ATPase subunit
MSLIIQLSAKNSIISKITTWITRGEFGHVDLVLPDGVLIGAHVFGGIKKTIFKKTDFSKIKRYEIEVSQDTIDWVKLQDGRKYDMMAILGFIFKIPVLENRASICSEFAFDALEKSKCFNHPIDFQSSKISPRDLHLILQTVEAVGCAKLISIE